MICGNSSVVSGFLLNDKVCGIVGENMKLEFHSVGDFRDWIEQVSGAVNFSKISSLLILSAVLINVKKFL